MSPVATDRWAKVTPATSALDVADSGHRYTKGGCNFRVSTRVFSDGDSLSLGKTRHRMLFSARLSALGHFVCNIIDLIAQKQMVDIHAQRIIAIMEHVLLWAYGVTKQSPSNSVGALLNNSELSHCARAVAAAPSKYRASPFNAAAVSGPRSGDKSMFRVHLPTVCAPIEIGKAARL